MQRGCCRDGVSGLHHFSGGIYPGDAPVDDECWWGFVGGGDGVREHLLVTHGQLMALLGDFLLSDFAAGPAPFSPQFCLNHSRLIFLAPPHPLPLPTRTATSRGRLPTAGPSAVSMAKTASPPPAALRYAAGGQKKQAAITRVVVGDCLLSEDWMFQRSIHCGSTTSPYIPPPFPR